MIYITNPRISVEAIKPTVPDTGKPPSRVEFCDLAQVCVLAHADGLAAVINDLVENEWAFAVNVRQAALNVLQIARPHVLGSVHPESLDADADEIIDEVGALLPNVVLAAVKISKAHEVAVPDLVHVIVVVNLTVGMVKVPATVGDARITLEKE
jgi:hypothetical protein